MSIYQELPVCRHCAKYLNVHCHEVDANIPMLEETNLASVLLPQLTPDNNS